MEPTKKVNLFPNKHGVSNYFSLLMIMHQENLDYEHYCRYHIREYVQAHNESQHKNINAAQSFDYVYLRSMENSQGGYELLHLQTNKVVNFKT